MMMRSFRLFSALMCALSLWAAYLQLNDPDPERWVAMYLACSVVAASQAASRLKPWLAALVSLVALAWALAILPELLSGWTPAELGARMRPERPDIEYGREFGGLSLVSGYCALAAWVQHRQQRGAGRAKLPS